MTILRYVALCVAAAAICGCAPLVPPSYSPDYPALDALKRAPLAKTSVGTVQPTDKEAVVNKIWLRASALAGPKGTFAAYLEDALVQDLREVSAYDADSKLRIDATILVNTINLNGFSTGSGQMKVEIVVSRAGASLLRKTYDASTEFESSFVGAIAIPKGQMAYPTLVRTLLSTVYADPAFVAALQP